MLVQDNLPMAIFRRVCGPPPTTQTHNRHPRLAGFLSCWYDTVHYGWADMPRCGTVTDLFRREVKQKKWSTGVQWDTVASYPVDFTHSSSCRHTSASSSGRSQLVSLHDFSSVHFTAGAEYNAAAYRTMLCLIKQTLHTLLGAAKSWSYQTHQLLSF